MKISKKEALEMLKTLITQHTAPNKVTKVIRFVESVDIVSIETIKKQVLENHDKIYSLISDEPNAKGEARIKELTHELLLKDIPDEINVTTDAKLRINSGLNINSVKVIDNDGNTITECPVEIGSLTYHMLNHKTESNDIQKDARVMAEFVEEHDADCGNCANCVHSDIGLIEYPCNTCNNSDKYNALPAFKVYKKYLGEKQNEN